jgi:hypothetical protein
LVNWTDNGEFLETDQHICPTGKSPISCPAPQRKIFRFPRRANQLYNSPVSPTEGALRNVINAGWDAVDADARLTKRAEADGEVVWS